MGSGYHENEPRDESLHSFLLLLGILSLMWLELALEFFLWPFRWLVEAFANRK